MPWWPQSQTNIRKIKNMKNDMQDLLLGLSTSQESCRRAKCNSPHWRGHDSNQSLQSRHQKNESNSSTKAKIYEKQEKIRSFLQKYDKVHNEAGDLYHILVTNVKYNNADTGADTWNWLLDRQEENRREKERVKDMSLYSGMNEHKRKRLTSKRRRWVTKQGQWLTDTN